jgi:4a-hydroxytetrahydrobiopterin dehydratase
MKELARKDCVPCTGKVPALKGAALKHLQNQLLRKWKVVKSHHLEKEFKFKNFKQALTFVNRVGDLAEQQSHHPDLFLAWGLVKVTIWTHAVKGLTESDFILAAKIEMLPQK